MKLIIDIPESIFNTIQADEMISREQLAILQMHILNGTPLDNVKAENKGDLISRQAVENITWEEPNYTDPLNVLTEVREKVRALPSVENKGEWKRISPAGIYECSRCGQNVMTSDIECYKFCHGCGARMKGGEK